ncbi:hypothetical protein BY996DRAFT_8391136 [Phakopsora pachyrhizi]|nr:hypothetical protein BY996DRAFT_8391136 [Phakopsora pachyrhizi]
MSTENVLDIQKEPVEQPLFRDEERLEAEAQAPTEEVPNHNTKTALESTINMKAQDTETLALMLCPFAELPKWFYVDLGNVVDEICEFLRAIDGNFTPSNFFKNIVPKSSSGFILIYEEILTVMLQSSSLKTHYGPDGESVIGGAGIKKYPNLEHKLTKNATESKVKFE